MSEGNPSSGTDCAASRRSDFLLEMYRQTSVHLGRHVTGVWQCAGVAGGALAVFVLDKNGPLNDYACALAIVLCGWLVATTLDASNWFNRNIKIISNIERLHLQEGDDKLVHSFYLHDRAPGKPAEHFQIQIYLALVVALLVLGFHFGSRVWSGFDLPFSDFQISRAVPYLALAIVASYCSWLHAHFRKRDEELQKSSPGLSTD